VAAANAYVTAVGIAQGASSAAVVAAPAAEAVAGDPGAAAAASAAAAAGANNGDPVKAAQYVVQKEPIGSSAGAKQVLNTVENLQQQGASSQDIASSLSQQALKTSGSGASTANRAVTA
jgi:hypothetical protein